MKLNALMARLPASSQRSGDGDPELTSVAIDSRAVTPGALFVAVRGTAVDGHAFVAQAIQRGAAAVVVESADALHEQRVPVVHVPDSRRALSTIAAAFYADPSHQLDVVGVTGTNGKTTVTRMIAAMLNAAGRPCGVIGTVGAEFGDKQMPLQNTTPLPPELQRILAQMRTDGAHAVAMEVSSHALVLDRVEDVRFAVGVLTNVTRDHLDFHGSVEAYAAAKRRLFGLAKAAVLNACDEHGRLWRDALVGRVPVLTYAIGEHADLVAREVHLEPGRSRFTVNGVPFAVAMTGRFNVENALAAIGAVRTLGVTLEEASRGLATLTRVPGRMEHYRGGGVDAVVDYAHTPDALAKALETLRETAHGSLSVVFGCGGDRDRGKRPEMGRIAAQGADRIYVTNDNPRTEEPSAIAAEITAGIGARPYVLELDRRAAIVRAIAEAQPGDTVLIAGKGHENYQIVGAATVPFDDAQIAREALALRGAQA